MRTIPPLAAGAGGQLKVRLVDDRRGVEGVAVSFPSKVTTGERLEVAVDERHQAGERIRLSGRVLGQSLRDRRWRLPRRRCGSCRAPSVPPSSLRACEPAECGAAAFAISYAGSIAPDSSRPGAPRPAGTKDRRHNAGCHARRPVLPAPPDDPAISGRAGARCRSSVDPFPHTATASAGCPRGGSCRGPRHSRLPAAGSADAVPAG